MSFSLEQNNIFLTKGDTFQLPIDFHQPIHGAKIDVAIYQEGTFDPKIKKTITEHTDDEQGKTLIYIEKEAFDDLPVGTYTISMSLTFLDDSKITFFPANPRQKALFHLTSAI